MISMFKVKRGFAFGGAFQYCVWFLGFYWHSKDCVRGGLYAASGELNMWFFAIMGCFFIYDRQRAQISVVWYSNQVVAVGRVERNFQKRIAQL